MTLIRTSNFLSSNNRPVALYSHYSILYIKCINVAIVIFCWRPHRIHVETKVSPLATAKSKIMNWSSKMEMSFLVWQTWFLRMAGYTVRTRLWVAWGGFTKRTFKNGKTKQRKRITCTKTIILYAITYFVASHMKLLKYHLSRGSVGIFNKMPTRGN